MDSKTQILSTIHDMTRAFNLGDIDGVMRTYEPTAAVVAEPGVPVSGDRALRALFAGFIAAKAQFTFAGHEVVEAGDIALHLMPWRMSGVGPDGAPINAGGLSIAVLRRQTDDRWLMVIDHPFGDTILNQPTSR